MGKVLMECMMYIPVVISESENLHVCLSDRSCSRELALFPSGAIWKFCILVVNISQMLG